MLEARPENPRPGGQGSAPAVLAAELRGVTRTYRQGSVEVHALRGVDLRVPRGAFMVLAGPSGSGKTTLLNQLGCLDRPTAGTVSVEGEEVQSLGLARRADLRLHRLGFIFQAFNLLPVLTALENAEMVLELQGVDRKTRRARVRPILEDLGIADLASRKPSEMSGGQQQRVAVARAIAHEPILLLADEPTANLDSHTSGRLIDRMLEMNRGRGITMLISSHDPALIERAPTVVRLRDGEVLEVEERPG